MAKQVGILLVAVVLAVGVNATSLLATKEYADHSTRSKSELSINPDGSPKEITSGLSKEYITQYSFGLLETFDLFIPRFMGGSNSEKLDKESYTYRFLKDKAGRKQALGFAENAPMYWGNQPIVAAPPYIGAVIYLSYCNWFNAGKRAFKEMAFGRNDFFNSTELGKEFRFAD